MTTVTAIAVCVSFVACEQLNLECTKASHSYVTFKKNPNTHKPLRLLAFTVSGKLACVSQSQWTKCNWKKKKKKKIKNKNKNNNNKKERILSFVYKCMQTRLGVNGKWPIGLVCVSRPLITVITAIQCKAIGKRKGESAQKLNTMVEVYMLNRHPWEVNAFTENCTDISRITSN